MKAKRPRDPNQLAKLMIDIGITVNYGNYGDSALNYP
jgi:hypothetical protein